MLPAARNQAAADDCQNVWPLKLRGLGGLYMLLSHFPSRPFTLGFPQLDRCLCLPEAAPRCNCPRARPRHEAGRASAMPSEVVRTQQRKQKAYSSMRSKRIDVNDIQPPNQVGCAGKASLGGTL
jgi:hypothetical protein